MDDMRFDRWSRHLAGSTPHSRRIFGAGMMASLAGVVLGANAEAKRKRKKKKKKNDVTPIAGCPNGCSFNERCVGNQCVPGCIGGTTPCGVNCCLDGAEACQNDVCVPLCSDRRPSCGGLCCGADSTCVNNACTAPCPAGRVTCGGQCCGEGEECDELGRCGAPCEGDECPAYVLDTAWGVSGLSKALFSPCGLDLDDAGNVYVLDCRQLGDQQSRVVKLSNAGAVVTEWPAAGYGLTVDGNETVYVASGGFTVAKFSTSGASQGTLSNLSSAHDVAVDDEGNVYVLGGSSVTIFNSQGTKVREWSPPAPARAFSNALGIVVDVEVGEVIVANTGAHLIQRFDVDSTFNREWGGFATCGVSGQPACTDPLRRKQFSSPTGVDVDEDGNIFVTDFGNDRVVMFEADGGYITQFGLGEMDGPDSVAVDANGNVYVAETLSKRVVRYVPANPARRAARAAGRGARPDQDGRVARDRGQKRGKRRQQRRRGA